MPRLKFKDIYDTVEGLAAISSSKRDFIKRGIQRGLDILTSQRNLPYLMSPGVIQLVAPVTTGTVAITDGSSTVTGTGTSFTAALVGRKIRIGSDIAYYRIKSFTSSVSIELDANYTGTTNSGLSYSVYKDEYRLPADANTYKIMRQIDEDRVLGSIESSAFDVLDPTPTAEGTPSFEIFRGTALDTYTTGTVSGTVNLSVITGSGTSWTTVEGLSRGTRITIGSNVYTVKSVDSDTQITIYESIVSTFSGSSYSVLLDNLIVQFDKIPDDELTIRFHYQRLAYPLINDQDIPDLPDEWQHILIRAGLVYAWMTKDKQEASVQETIFAVEKQEFWNKVSNISLSRRYPRMSQDVEMYQEFPGQPVYPANFGIPTPIKGR